MRSDRAEMVSVQFLDRSPRRQQLARRGTTTKTLAPPRSFPHLPHPQPRQQPVGRRRTFPPPRTAGESRRRARCGYDRGHPRRGPRRPAHRRPGLVRDDRRSHRPPLMAPPTQGTADDPPGLTPPSAGKWCQFRLVPPPKSSGRRPPLAGETVAR